MCLARLHVARPRERSTTWLPKLALPATLAFHFRASRPGPSRRVGSTPGGEARPRVRGTPGFRSPFTSVPALFPGRYVDVGQAGSALTGSGRARPAEEQLERVPRER